MKKRKRIILIIIFLIIFGFVFYNSNYYFIDIPNKLILDTVRVGYSGKVNSKLCINKKNFQPVISRYIYIDGPTQVYNLLGFNIGDFGGGMPALAQDSSGRWYDASTPASLDRSNFLCTKSYGFLNYLNLDYYKAKIK